MGKTLERKELTERSSQLFDCYYCYVNLLGNEAGRMIFDGEILVAKNGELLLKNEILSFADHQIQVFDFDKNREKYPLIVFFET